MPDSNNTQMTLSTEEFDEQNKSKSQIKRDMLALQQAGLRLTQLNDRQLATIELEPILLNAIHDFQSIRKNEAKRRQLQYIGRIMRNVDAEPILHAINTFESGKKENTQHFHNIERWRDQLLKHPSATTEFLAKFPHTNSQHLRQLTRNAANTKTPNPSHGRKLFRYLKEVIDNNP